MWILNISIKRHSHLRMVLLEGGKREAMLRFEQPKHKSNNTACCTIQRYHLRGGMHSGSTEQLCLQKIQRKRKMGIGFKEATPEL